MKVILVAIEDFNVGEMYDNLFVVQDMLKFLDDNGEISESYFSVQEVEDNLFVIGEVPDDLFMSNK